MEIGTVTPKPQAGNDKPRLFRLPKDKALINRMGFNNDGVEVVAERLKKWKLETGKLKMHNEQDTNFQLSTFNSKLIIGGNIGKNKTTPNEDAWKDYEICFTALHPYVDYFVVNVSSPNTPGLRELQEKDSLKKILENLQTQNLKFEIQRPILLKIAPDLNTIQLDEIIELVNETNIDGVIASNTSTSREGLKASKEQLAKIGPGGLSGQPVKNKSTEVIQYLADTSHKSFPIIGVGGIHSEKDALEKIKAGADLVQVYTGFIYEGPSLIKRINKAILQQS